MHATGNNHRLPIQMLVLAGVVVFGLFAWQGSVGFNLADEGFLWYGAKRVMLGDVPIRDFMAYDPGRYYWSAGWMSLWRDDGIMSLRQAVAAFQAAGMFAGLLLLARTANKWNPLFALLCAVTMAAWMFPRHKLFDISLSIFLIGALTFLIQHPTSRRYFLAGLCVGLAAVFGRNHGVYGAAGSAGVILWLALGRAEGPGLAKAGASWALGVAAGFAPVLLMALLVPGFAAAFWDSIRFLFEIKTTNLPLPAPWPWRVDLASGPPGDVSRKVLIGVFFVAILAFGILGPIWVVLRRLQRRPVPAALAAASILALPYAHFAYSRADVSHLAQGIFPFLIGCLAPLGGQSARVRWPLALLLCAASLWVMHPFHPGWQCRAGTPCVDTDISHDTLLIDPATASDIRLLQALADRYAADGKTFVAVPLWPGAYPVLDRESPIWEIYPLFPRPAAFELAEIRRIEAAAPGFVIVIDVPLDGREELRFRNTHPLTQQYIQEHFEQIPDSPNPAYLIYKAKG